MKPLLWCGESLPFHAVGGVHNATGGWIEAVSENPWYVWTNLVVDSSHEPPCPQLGIYVHPKGHLYRLLGVARHHVYPRTYYAMYTPLYPWRTGLALRQLSDFLNKMKFLGESLPVEEMTGYQLWAIAQHLTLDGARQLFTDCEKQLPRELWNLVGRRFGFQYSWRRYFGPLPPGVRSLLA